MNIEKLAFKNYYELINVQKIDLLLIIEFLQNDRKQWINQFTQTHNESVEIQKENKKLKDNWNKLKEYIKETKLKEFEKSYGKRYGKTFTQAEIIVCNMILDKMQELEQGSDSNVKD